MQACSAARSQASHWRRLHLPGHRAQLCQALCNLQGGAAAPRAVQLAQQCSSSGADPHPQLGAQAAPHRLCLVAVHDAGQRVHGLAVDEDVEPLKVGRPAFS